jgi:hypothetical protein
LTKGQHTMLGRGAAARRRGSVAGRRRGSATTKTGTSYAGPVVGGDARRTESSSGAWARVAGV